MSRRPFFHVKWVTEDGRTSLHPAQRQSLGTYSRKPALILWERRPALATFQDGSTTEHALLLQPGHLLPELSFQNPFQS